MMFKRNVNKRSFSITSQVMIMQPGSSNAVDFKMEQPHMVDTIFLNADEKSGPATQKLARQKGSILCAPRNISPTNSLKFRKGR